MFCLLVGHGSRDPRYQAVFAWCVQQAQMALAPMPIRGAVLEHHPLSLGEQMLGYVRELEDPEVRLIPLFMAGGVHLHRDIPAQVCWAQQRYPQLRIEITPAWGSQRSVIRLLGDRLSPDYPWIVVAHGSRRPSFAQDIAHILHQVKAQKAGLGIQIAFLSQAPTLPDQMQYLYDRGYRQVGLQPFLLFPGGLLEVLQEQIHQHPLRNLFGIRWGSPFAPDPLVIEGIVELVKPQG